MFPWVPSNGPPASIPQLTVCMCVGLPLPIKAKSRALRASGGMVAASVSRFQREKSARKIS